MSKGLLKSVSIALLFAMAFVIVPLNVVSADVNAHDVSKHWAGEQISQWISMGLISGYTDGSFKPDNYITRAEFFALINRMFGFGSKAEINFPDVPKNAWYYDQIALAIKAGLISGYPDGTIRPNNYISRQEAAVVVARAFDFKAEKSAFTSNFIDHKDIGVWAAPYVSLMRQKGFISGYPDGSFGPFKNIKRGETVTILDNVAGIIVVKSGTFSEYTHGNLVVTTGNVILKNMTIKGNLYLTEGIGSGLVTLENIIVEGTTNQTLLSSPLRLYVNWNTEA